MKQREKIIAGTFHVVGGGCFGCQYAKWLLRARELGWLEFSRLKIIDRDPGCRWARENDNAGGVELVVSDWMEYFSNLISTNEVISDSNDHWVPAPLSPHILFEGFCRAAESRFGGLKSSPVKFANQVGTPVQIPLESGALAVSFAEWTCPVNCIEPPTCPAIHRPRHWDMKRNLGKYFSKRQEVFSWHVLQCRHLIHGVGTIPLRDIYDEYQKFLRTLEGQGNLELVVATVSGCHGLIAQASLET